MKHVPLQLLLLLALASGGALTLAVYHYPRTSFAALGLSILWVLWLVKRAPEDPHHP